VPSVSPAGLFVGIDLDFNYILIGNIKPIHALVCSYIKQPKMKKLIRIGLFIAAIIFASPKIYAQVSVGVSISANIAPPAIPDYDQPLCPVDGYLWQPGYWAYDNGSGGYYWVPGVWVAPPTVGYLWTPNYWGYSGGVYVYHAGYWGPHVGFYGGINYGYGYFGSGFAGGGWQGGRFRYNTAVVHVNTTVIHNTYVDRTVIRNTNNRVSYNGGRGGVTARPNTQQEQAMREHHVQATSEQISHQQAASKNRSQFASVNHGRPSVTATSRVNNHANNPATNRQPNNAAQNRTTANNHAVQQHAQQQEKTQQQHAQQLQRTQQQQRTQVQAQQQQRAQQQHTQQNQAQQQQRAQQQRAQQSRVQQQRAQVQPQQRAQRVSQPHGNPGREPQRHR
jgi:hypothetical protein